MKNKRKLSAFAATTVLLTTLMALGSVVLASSNAQPMVEVQINGQLNICHPPNPCVMVTLQAQAMGLPDSLTGMLRAEPYPPLDSGAPPTSSLQQFICRFAAPVGGHLTLSQDAPPIVTLIGTLVLTGHANTPGPQCVANLAGVTVTLVGDSSNGAITLTAPSGNPNAPPETIGFTYGTVMVQYTRQTSTTT